MTKYLYTLNWILLIAVIAVGGFLAPLLHTHSITVGAVLAAMFTGGLSSWNFYRDQHPEKDKRWRNRYFNKDYPTEILAQLAIAAFFALIGCYFTRVAFAVTGFAAIMALNYCVEALYAARTHKFPPA